MTGTREPRHPHSAQARAGDDGATVPHREILISPNNLAQTTDTGKLGAAAIAYAEAGWPVLPCVPRDKAPLTPHGYHDASNDLEQVLSWWRRWPDANIGLVPGRVQLDDGGTLLVLDVDGPIGGASAQELRVPLETVQAKTGRGLHLWYRVPAGVRLGNRTLATGIDVRHCRGYVLAPPAIHPSGHVYRWLVTPWDATPLPLPDHLLERLLPAAAPEPSRHHIPSESFAELRVQRYLARFPHGLEDGRKGAAFRLAAFLRHDAALSVSGAMAVLAGWNAANRPPLPHAILERIAGDAAKYGGRRAG